MPLSDRTRIERQHLKPRIVELWKALAPLKTVVSFMNTGAHPDDETTAMLVALGLRDGLDISYACSTRGEGGQNDIGTESGPALGALRTAEMERACDAINLRMYWLSQHPDDTISDFGFSKSGDETMQKWGKDRVLSRFVDIVRSEKPDIICPTFLDIPGQHGHHRAMTQAAQEVFDLSADPSFAGSDLEPWQISKLYLPAWSGAGRSYDDDLPPPPASLVIEAKGVDPVTGFSYEQIAQQSRQFHKTQAMGTWMPPGSERDWPLHLARTSTSGEGNDLFAGIPKTLRDLGLDREQDLIDAAIAAFPDYQTVLLKASEALKLLKAVVVSRNHEHRIRRKCEQLSQVIRLAAGAHSRVILEHDIFKTTDQTGYSIEKSAGIAENQTIRLALPQGWSVEKSVINLEDASLSDPYPDKYLPGFPQKPYVVSELRCHDVLSETYHSFEVSPVVVPSKSVEFSPSHDVINLCADRRFVDIKIAKVVPENSRLELITPSGWTHKITDAGFRVTIPEHETLGSYAIKLMLDGKKADSFDTISHTHTDTRVLTEPAEIAVQIIATELPNVKIGYIGAGHDTVPHWLGRLGCDVETLESNDFSSTACLDQFDTIVLGIFSIRFCDGLLEAMPGLHRWVEAGGTLLSLYHRPWDNWDPQQTPPKFLEIGQPSLRWRVTNEQSKIKYLAKHDLFDHPNEITATDWDGWHKERGLYFAKSWDECYIPLIETSDEGEDPLQGALLAADIGYGRHIHCSLILHHQMEKMVPGAFRIFVNLLSKRNSAAV